MAIEYRWAEGQYDRLPAMVADLIRHQPIVIAANSPAPVRAARVATTTIPIVFATGVDPVAVGLKAIPMTPSGPDPRFDCFLSRRGPVAAVGHQSAQSRLSRGLFSVQGIACSTRAK